MMSEYELLATLTAALVRDDTSVQRAVAEARAILDKLKTQEPLAYQAHVRGKIAQAQRRHFQKD